VAHEGQVLEGPNGYRLRLVRIADDVLEMEARYAGRGDLPPPHLHPRQAEHFTVLDGPVRVVIEGQEQRFAQGETFDVPAGTVHQLAGDGPASVKWEVRPALNTAEFFEDLYTGTAAENPNAFLERYTDEFRLVGPSG
jgi:quercetin dioxygenase-like cupin family protein